MAGTTSVKPCTCKHPGQDKMYGQGLRLHNLAAKGRDVKGWRCTVCGLIKNPSAEDRVQAPAKPEEKK